MFRRARVWSAGCAGAGGPLSGGRESVAFIVTGGALLNLLDTDEEICDISKCTEHSFRGTGKHAQKNAELR